MLPVCPAVLDVQVWMVRAIPQLRGESLQDFPLYTGIYAEYLSLRHIRKVNPTDTRHMNKFLRQANYFASSVVR